MFFIGVNLYTAKSSH